MSISCCCMDMCLILLILILLPRFSQRGNLVVGGGQWADHDVPEGGPWSTGGKWMLQRAASAHAPIPDLTFIGQKREQWGKKYKQEDLFEPTSSCLNPCPNFLSYAPTNGNTRNIYFAFHSRPINNHLSNFFLQISDGQIKFKTLQESNYLKLH